MFTELMALSSRCGQRRLGNSFLTAAVAAAGICLLAGTVNGEAQPRSSGILIYTNALSSSPGAEWSATNMDITPKGERAYLGKFYTQSVALALGQLPEHKLLRVSFDLFLMQSWDGSTKYWGECFWDLDVINGANLIHTTFGNCGFFCDNNAQAFPDNWPCGPYPAWTGSVEHQTLGVMQSWGGPERTFDCSSVYHIDLAFPHSSAAVSLQFKGTPTTNPDKPWGLCNVRVEALPELAKFSDSEFAALWEKLADPDPVTAFQTKWRLIAGGEAAAIRLAKIQDGAVLTVDSSTNVNHSGESLDTLRLHRAKHIIEVVRAGDSTPLTSHSTFALPVTAVASAQPIRVGLGLITDHQFTFRAEGLSGKRPIVVEASSDMLNWKPILTNTTPETVLDISIPFSEEWPTRFFRIVEQ